MIKCALVTLLFFLMIPTDHAFGQGETATQGLSFFTKHEELYFKDVVNGNTKQLFNLFLSLDSSYSRKAMVMDSNYYFSHLRTIQAIPKPTKKYSKYLKSVYDDLHSKFLRKYNLENSFSEVFTKGEYNCVSAVMLYSLTLDGIGIPYEIKETPSHVYLVASPGNEQILIETTDPVSGFNNITAAFKQNFIKTLVENKLVGSSEYNGTNTNELFDQYYFKAKSISLAQLAGLQYFNSGIFFFEKKDYLKAYQQFQKSNSLYANDKTESLVYAAGATYLSETDYASLLPVKILASLLKFEKNKPSKNEVEGEFARITNEMLNDRYDTKMYDAAYELLSLNIEDLSLRTNVDYIYNYERGRHMVIRNQFKEAIPYLENAYVIKPSNIETENLFVANLAASFEGEKHFSEDVEKISIRHPALQRNTQFTSLVLTSYLLEMHDNYSKSRPNEGNFFKVRFENGIEGKSQTFKDHDMIGWAYSQAAVYHFKKGETSKAKSILQKGLEYSPNNYELKSRLLMIAR